MIVHFEGEEFDKKFFHPAEVDEDRECNDKYVKSIQ